MARSIPPGLQQQRELSPDHFWPSLAIPWTSLTIPSNFLWTPDHFFMLWYEYRKSRGHAPTLSSSFGQFSWNILYYCCFLFTLKLKSLGAGSTSFGMALEAMLSGRWDRTSDLVGGDDSAGNTLQLQGNKTEWKQWRHVYAEERNAMKTFPVFTSNMLVSSYEAEQFWGLSWLQWCGIRVGPRQLVGFRLLMMLCTKGHIMLLFHRVDGHGFNTPFPCYLAPPPLTPSWIVGQKTLRWKNCCSKDII